MDRPLILYHKDCSDGFGSAYAAWKHFGDNADYRALSNGESTPVEEMMNRKVFFLDIAPKVEAIDAVLKLAKHVSIIDHHGTNESVANRANAGLFSLNRSGATLTWQYFHESSPIPKLLLLIEDMDLWRFILPETKEIMLALSLVPKKFIAWDAHVKLLETSAGQASEYERGSLLLGYSDMEIEETAREAEPIFFEGYHVLMANAPSRFASALGHMLAKKKGPIALVWSRRAGQYKVSLRSDGTCNAGEIAQKYGGGGHPGAAAFTITTEAWPAFLQRLLEN